MADIHGSLGEYQKSRKLLEQALSILLGIAKVLTNLGAVYGYLVDYKKAGELLERALLILEHHYGSDHPEVALTITNLGGIYVYLGDYQKARELWQQTLSISDKWET